MIFGGFLDTDLTNQCYVIDHNRQSIQKMKKTDRRRNVNPAHASSQANQRANPRPSNQRAADNRAENSVSPQRSAQNQNAAGSGSNPPNLGALDQLSQENEEPVLPNQSSPADQLVTMKKSKKFIKFKDYIIKLPNSMGLIGSRTTGASVLSNDLAPFVEQRDESEGPGGVIQPASGEQNEFSAPSSQRYNQHDLHGKDKGYSIYVVDDEHEIHRFDIDKFEWSIISTTKD